MELPILNLDISKNIGDFGININTTYLPETVYKLIELIKNYGKFIKKHTADIDIYQYAIKYCYLKKFITLYFEFDMTYQYINISIYNPNTENFCLKIFLSITEQPIIKYIENDKTGFITGYNDEKIKLKTGEYLINFAHCFLSHIGYQRCRLDDDSYLIIENENGVKVKVKLWLYYLLIHEKSYYAKSGYNPANSTDYEYLIRIRDVQNINLPEIKQKLEAVINSENKHYLDKTLVETSQRITEIIKDFNGTLLQYTRGHDIITFAKLVNNLFQSIFSKKVMIKNSKNQDEKYNQLDFPWYDKYMALFIANVCQVNNNIGNFYYRIE